MPRPTQPRLDPAVALAYLRQREASFTTQLLLLIAFGLPLSLLGPLLIAFFYWFYHLGHRSAVPFLPTFLLSALVTVPLLFLLAHITKGSILESATHTVDVNRVAGRYVARRAAVPLAFLELANIGPRM